MQRTRLPAGPLILVVSRRGAAAMDQLTVYGEVIATRGSDLGVRVENEQDLRAYWQAHEVDTDADWFGPGAPVLSINRRRDVAACRSATGSA